MQINTNFSSPNYSPRSQPVEYIMVHFTEMLFEEALEKLTDEKSKVSAHYLIKEDGEIFQLVSDDYIAWHAGKSLWHGKEALNENSIGIELDNLGTCEFTEAQMNACIKLSKKLISKHNINPRNFIGHSDVAPDRKIDPGIFFDWELCAKNNLGIWHDMPNPTSSKILYNFGESGDDIKNLQSNLEKLGYTIKTTGIFDQQTNFVVRAFQSKFYPHSILTKGVEYYFNQNSIYPWCSFSESILHKILHG